MDKTELKLNYKDLQKRWGKYHRFEREYKKETLRKMSAEDSYRLFDSLYCLYNSLDGHDSFDKLDMDTVKTLSRVHHMFGKVRA